VIERLSRALFGRRQPSLEQRLGALTERLDQLSASNAETLDIVRSLPPALADFNAQQAAVDERLEAMLRFVVDGDAENRRRLHALRNSLEYALPFEDPDPLVSVTIATRDRAETLVSRALPSILAQTHRNIEVLIVGDAAGPEVAEAVAAVVDPRVRYANLTQRTTAHPDPARHRLVGSTIPRNEATRLARGLWLLHFDDDDTLHPDAIASLLELARASRAEVVYGGFVMHRAGWPDATLMAFPPELGRFGWQGALAHAGLRFFERELIAAYFDLPGDVYLMQRMLRTGVRFALLERVIWDYYPS
jgi:Glycosyl transferase family 2